MEATTNSRLPHLASDNIKRSLKAFKMPSGQRVWGLDVFPCPIELFELLADIVILYETQPNRRRMSPNATYAALDLSNAVADVALCTDSKPRRHIGEVWRCGILLFLIRLFPLCGDTINTRGISNTLFQHARLIPAGSSWSYSTSWPLFQAGLLLSHGDSHTKTWLRTELSQRFKRLGCFHQKLAVDALEQTWQSGGCQVDGPFDSNLGSRKFILY